MVDGERQPMLLCLILLVVVVREYEKDRIEAVQADIQAAKVIVHEGLNCLMNVINDAFQFVVFIGVNLYGR